MMSSVIDRAGLQLAGQLETLGAALAACATAIALRLQETPREQLALTFGVVVDDQHEVAGRRRPPRPDPPLRPQR